MNSPGHRENILNPKLEEIGVGSATSKDGKLFWTQDFGTPMGGSAVANKPMSTPGVTNPKGMKMAADSLGSTTVGNPKDLQQSKDPVSRPANKNRIGMKMSFVPTDMKTFEDMKQTPMFSGDVKNSRASTTDPMGSAFNPIGAPDSNPPIGTPTN